MYEWYKKLFKLKPHLQIKYEKFLKKAKPNNDTKLICAQIRLGNRMTKSGFIDVEFTNRNNTLLYWNFIDKLFIDKLPDRNYMIYVTADDESVKQEALSYFEADKVIFSLNSSSHIDKDVKGCSSEIENIILDFHALQLCDMAVISQSGFGYLGLWNRPIPNKKSLCLYK